ncbi:MAG TPA: dethiobiotin synthase [Steroidobacteraceae bacterium]
MTRGYFVTGTDTGVGKTVVTAGLLRLLARQGVRAVGLKPVASGGERNGRGELRNVDALELQAAAPVRLPYASVNPWCFAPAIAPHLAAREAGQPILVTDLADWYGRVTADVDLALVEGAGGWRVPLHPRGFLSDLPEAVGLDVILVVGLTLGCLNHARLTAEAIASSGRCRLAGWVANAVDPGFERRAENLETLSDLLGSRPLAEVPRLDGASRSPCGNPIAEFQLTPQLCAALGVAQAG